MACKPGSVVYLETDGHSSWTFVTKRLSRDLPEWRRENSFEPLLFGLAPDGVYHAGNVTIAAVRSYRTLSPLPQRFEALFGGFLSVALSLRFPSHRELHGIVFPWADFPLLDKFTIVKKRPSGHLMQL